MLPERGKGVKKIDPGSRLRGVLGLWGSTKKPSKRYSRKNSNRVAKRAFLLRGTGVTVKKRPVKEV